MENIYDEKELEEYYDVFKVETERFVEEIFHKGFNKGMEKIWEYLNCASSLNCVKYDELFGLLEITDILREFTPTEFIDKMDTIDPKKLKELCNMIAQREDPKNIDEEYEAGINDLWDKLKKYAQTEIHLYYFQLDRLLCKPSISNFYNYEKEKCTGLYTQGVVDLYESLKEISKLSEDDFLRIFETGQYHIIEKTPEEIIQIMKPYLEKKEDNDD